MTDSACNSLTRRAVAMANKKADLRESHLIAESVNGSNGVQERLLKTKFRSHCGTIALRLGGSRLTPFKKLSN